MNPKRTPTRRYFAGLLLLSGVLVLVIFHWSFLTILIPNGPISSTSVLEMSAGHSSKFAAPFKCLFGDGLRPCLVQSRITLRMAASRVVRLTDVPISRQDDFSLTHRPLRAPPSA